MTDAERIASFSARQRGENVTASAAALNLSTITPRAVAELYRDGKALSDEQIRQLRDMRNPAWLAAVDVEERARLLEPAKPAPTGLQLVVKATGKEARNITAGLSRLEKILLSPVRPIYDDRGRLLGGERVLSDLPEPDPAPESQRATPDKPKASGDKRRPVTILSNLCKMIHLTFKDLIGAHNEIAERASLIEQRVAALEARGWKGVWDDAMEYTEGQECTLKGNRWYCRVGSTKARPGASADWVMTNKDSERNR